MPKAKKVVLETKTRRVIVIGREGESSSSSSSSKLPKTEADLKLDAFLSKAIEDFGVITDVEWKNASDTANKEAISSSTKFKMFFVLFIHDFCETFRMDPNVPTNVLALAQDEHNVTLAKKFVETWKDFLTEERMFITPPVYLTDNVTEDSRNRCILSYYYAYGYAAARKKACFLKLSEKSMNYIGELRLAMTPAS